MAIQAQFYSDNLEFSMGTTQDLLIENAPGFDHQQRFMQFQHFLVDDNSNNNNNIQQQSTAFSHSVSAHIEKQRLEFEHLFNLQNERLRLAMQEQRKQQIALLMKKYESRTIYLLKQKEEEIANATSRTMELQNYLKRMEIENQTWQRAAKEKEAIVASLNCRIQQLKESACLSTEDAESCCQNINIEEEKREMVCKCCNYRSSCVVMLPCRHLSSCKHCELFLDSCPLCKMPKKATIEALI